METRIIDGRSIAKGILEQVKSLIESSHLSPRLLILQVGNDAPSNIFVDLKKKRGLEIGIDVKIIKIVAQEESDLIKTITSVIQENQTEVDGIMIQLPLPADINTRNILALIPKQLDVDGLLLENSTFPTAVAAAVIEILESCAVDKEKHILVLGTSPYVGDSIIRNLRSNSFTNVSGIDETTERKDMHLATADIVISCIGKPRVYTTCDLKPGAILIDVGTSKDTDGKIVGDFDTTTAHENLTAYTPVPGGVGPVTVAMLLKNVAENAIKN